MDKIREWFGNEGKLTPAALLSILVFAIVGVLSAPLLTWFAKGAYDEFRDQSRKLSSIELFLAGASERARTRDVRLDSAEITNRSQQIQLADHERRLIRIEVPRGIAVP